MSCQIDALGRFHSCCKRAFAPCWPLALAGIFVLTLLPGSPCGAQVLRPEPSKQADVRPPFVQKKKVIEGHFESARPTPRPQFDGVVPGARLLEQHRMHSAKVQGRAKASLAVHPRGQTPNASFAPGILLRPSLPAGALPTSVVTGDFNRDGHMDFIVANGLTNDLWIYLGNGDGTFQLPRIVPLSRGLAPVGIATGDLRGDGKLDIVVAEADTSSIGILLGNGDGTFGYEQEYSLPEPPESVVIDDFNHDGKADIAAVMVTTVAASPNAIPYIALLTGDGSGGFGAPTITNTRTFAITAWNITSGDVNNDGLSDLLITGPGFENSQVFLSNGDGTFKAGAIVVANNPDTDYPMVLDGRLGDLNGDGCLDAAVADINTMVWVAFGDCAGHFTAPQPVYMGGSNASVRIADVNRDGHPDIIAASFPGISPYYGFEAGDTLNVALGDGKGNFGPARTYVGDGQAYSIGVADFTGDGRPDFVTANNDTDTVTAYLNDGSGDFGFPQGIYAGVPGQGTIDAPISSVSFPDLNNDGKTDVFFLDLGMTGEYFASGFLNDGTGRFNGPFSTDMGIGIVDHWIGDCRLGNFRKTGLMDMVAIGLNTEYSEGAGFILFLPGNGNGTFGKGKPVATVGADGILTTGDFNNDGKLDFVAVGGSPTAKVTAFLGNADGTFHSAAPVTLPDGMGDIARVYSGDFNHDGKLDILVFTTANGYWTTASAVWEFDGNGDGTFQSAKKLFSDFQPIALADVNGDGRPDIARYDTMWPDGETETLGPATFTNYLGLADGSFKESSSYAPYAGVPISVMPYEQFGDPLASSLVGDFSGNGKPDEVAFQRPGEGPGESYAQFLMGNGDGTFTPTYNIVPFAEYGYPLYAHSLDSSGIDDMVELDNGTSAFHVFKGGPAPALQIALEDSTVTGNSSCGWVFLNLPSSSSATIALSSTVSGVALPSSVTVPANALAERFCYTLAGDYDWRQVFDINAQFNGTTATAYASDSYVLGFDETVSQSTVPPIYVGQTTAPITVSLTSSQGYTSSVKLYCEGMNPGDSCQFGSTSLDVSPAAVASTTVAFAIGPTSAEYGSTSNFTIVADDGNVIQRQTVAVSVASLNMWSFASTSFNTASPGTVTTTFVVVGIPPYALSCSGLPPGATCTFSGTFSAYPNHSGMNLTVAIPAGLAAGGYPIQVVATSGPQTASMQLNLQVLPPAPTPVISPAGGVYSTPQKVTIQDSGANAMIFYTTDGTKPSMSSTSYGNYPITVSATETVQAIAIASNCVPSAVASAAFVFELPQNINFPQPTSPIPYGAGPVTLSATGGPSGKPVVFSVLSGPGSISGNILTFSGAGTVLVAANQLGNNTYAPATQVTQNIVESKGGAKLSLANLAQVYTGSPISITATTIPAGLPVGITYNGSPAPPTAAKSYPVIATIEDPNLAGVATGTLTISKAAQNITFLPLPSSVIYGSSSFALSATSSSGLPVTLSVTGPAKFSGATLTITGAGTVTITASQVGNGNYSAAAAVSRIVSVNKAPLTVTATSVSAPYGQTLPKLTYATAGYVNGESSSVLKGAPTETTTARQWSAVGSYPITITQGSLTAANYSFTFVNGTVTMTSLGTTATPVIRLAAGTYTSAQTATIADPTNGASIYYTTNGTTPSASSTKYTSAGIRVTATETINAIAVAPGYTQSAVATAAYVIATAPKVTTAAASNVNTPSATLNGIVTANNAAAQYWFTYGTSRTALTSITAKTGGLTGSTATPVSATIAGLKTKTTYYFEVVASNAVGTTSGTVLNFTTN